MRRASCVVRRAGPHDSTKKCRNKSQTPEFNSQLLGLPKIGNPYSARRSATARAERATGGASKREHTRASRKRATELKAHHAHLLARDDLKSEFDLEILTLNVGMIKHTGLIKMQDLVIR